MIINYFNLESIAFVPDKTNSPLVVYSYAMLPDAIALQWLEHIAGRYSQISQQLSRVKNFKLSHGWPENRRKPAGTRTVEDAFCLFAFK